MPNFEAAAHAIANTYTPPRTGNHSRITEPDTVQAFLDAVQAGNYIDTACHLADLSKVTVYDWIKRGEAGEDNYVAFANNVKRAQARAEAEAVVRVRKAADDPRFWAAEMTFLERRHPEKWGRRQDSESGPKVIVQIGARDSDVQVMVTGHHNAAYQTQTLGEGQQTQTLPDTLDAVCMAKVEGESA